MQPCPWSGQKLKKLGKHIRDGGDLPAGLPDYDEVMLWYNELAAYVQRRILAVDWSPLLRERSFEVTSRPKTIDTLRQKLKRDPNTPLPSVQDIAGVRFEAEMSLDEQDGVVNAIAGLFDHPVSECARDLRSSPHSGYRAVHIWLRLEGRVEVQVRTHLQGHWANAYESAADLFGRDIRYEQLPEDPVRRNMVMALRSMSTERIAQMEKDRNEIEQITLNLEENSVKAGSKGWDEFTELRTRLNRLRARFQSNEVRMQNDLQELRTIFVAARGDERV